MWYRSRTRRRVDVAFRWKLTVTVRWVKGFRPELKETKMICDARVCGKGIDSSIRRRLPGYWASDAEHLS